MILWRLCDSGEAAHTHHKTLEEALDQAEFKFEVSPTGWNETNESFRSLKEYVK